MKVISGGRVFRRGILFYRKLRYRKGHGVHSPFMFNFIIKVIDERASYYCLNDIGLTRKKLACLEDTFSLPDKKHPERICKVTAAELVNKIAIKPKSGALLMRISNYFKPRTILQVGCNGGLSTLYLSSYASAVHCTVWEENEEMRSACRLVFEKHKAKNISLPENTYREGLPAILAGMEKPDMVYLDTNNSTGANAYAIEQCLPYMHAKSVLIISGIRASKEKKLFWKQLCMRPETGVCVDVYEFGIVFFNKKLHKRNYIVSF